MKRFIIAALLTLATIATYAQEISIETYLRVFNSEQELFCGEATVTIAVKDSLLIVGTPNGTLQLIQLEYDAEEDVITYKERYSDMPWIRKAMYRRSVATGELDGGTGFLFTPADPFRFSYLIANVDPCGNRIER